VSGAWSYDRSDADIKGELCAGLPTLVPEDGAFAVIPPRVASSGSNIDPTTGVPALPGETPLPGQEPDPMLRVSGSDEPSSYMPGLNGEIVSEKSSVVVGENPSSLLQGGTRTQPEVVVA
jgi:hypothetical protein